MGGAIATRYLPLNVTTPAGTAIAAPQTTAVDLGHVILLDVRVRIAAGHAGLTGIRIDYSGTTIVPWSNPAAWIIGDDEPFLFDVEREVGNTLKVVTYNVDVNDHTHFLLWKVTDITVDSTAPVQLVDITPAA